MLTRTLLIGSCALSRCGKDDDYKLRTMIRVVGAEGIAFSGLVGTLGSSSSISGITPQDFILSPKDAISGVIQKSSPGDLREMIVECWHNSGFVAETAKTSEEFGVASVVCD